VACGAAPALRVRATPRRNQWSTESMFEERSHKRTFYSAPQSVNSLVAAFLEPAITVGVFLGVSVWFGEPIVRSDLALCLLVFALTFPGRNRFQDRPLNAFVDISASWLTLLLILALCGYATRSLELFDPQVLLAWALLTPVLQWTAFYVGRRLQLRWWALPQNRRAAVVIGAGPLGVKVARALQQPGHGASGFAGYFDDRADDRIHGEAARARVGRLKEAAPWIREHGVDEVYITLPLGSQPRIVELLEQLQGTTASIFFVPDVFGISIIQGRLQDINGVPVVGLCETPFTGTNELVKRVSDVVLASLILLLVSPLMLAIATAVKLSSPGPVIFRQRRNGLAGEEIVVWKFRTMTSRDDGDEVRQATRDDARITRVGALLRRSSLDELPQFFNVLQGHMSIVGPRPHAVAHNEQYRRLIKAYMVRHKVKPGITGWAQIHGHRGETDTLEKMQARVEYDLEYLRNWSLGLDLQIIARTIKLVLFDRKAY
jgi:putative colanic acid biosysnthesis UDP-glucose lipid carrier transferase